MPNNILEASNLNLHHLSDAASFKVPLSSDKIARLHFIAAFSEPALGIAALRSGVTSLEEAVSLGLIKR